MEPALTRQLMVVDAANVMGSRPDGWWRDRSAAAVRLVAQIAEAVRGGGLSGPVAVVLEGAARGAPIDAADAGAVRIVEAAGSGDDRILEVAAAEMAGGVPVVVVTADRGLRLRVESLGASVLSPRWLLQRL